MRAATGEAQKFLREVVLPYDGTECLIWPFAKTKKGYAQIGIDGKTRLVSRVVCEKAHGPSPSPRHHAAHNCGHGYDACVARRHLAWKTPAENEAEKRDHGKYERRGRQFSKAKGRYYA